MAARPALPAGRELTGALHSLDRLVCAALLDPAAHAVVRRAASAFRVSTRKRSNSTIGKFLSARIGADMCGLNVDQHDLILDGDRAEGMGGFLRGR